MTRNTEDHDDPSRQETVRPTQMSRTDVHTVLRPGVDVSVLLRTRTGCYKANLRATECPQNTVNHRSGTVTRNLPKWQRNLPYVQKSPEVVFRQRAGMAVVPGQRPKTSLPMRAASTDVLPYRDTDAALRRSARVDAMYIDAARTTTGSRGHAPSGAIYLVTGQRW
ncbi:hypothetical protein DAEQUDRAFT_6 [Daedalea quercina L-15889]|uniref:Uncharacterized protein n=1 Tax=Daedalea quercina L-15889 TaxID=1314783 RepID=A0A165UAI0_9APHY|nr:hypothetical protein DAEQUDRAFT_6 [Daedalea quercina L-15889]